MWEKFYVRTARHACINVVMYLISLQSIIGWRLSLQFYDERAHGGYIRSCQDENFDESNTCSLTQDNKYRSLRFVKGSCVELKHSGETVTITEDTADLGRSFQGGNATKCESYAISLHCPDGTFAKSIEWDTEFELTKGFKLSCYEPKFEDESNATLQSHPGSELLESDKRKCASISGITFQVDDTKDAVVGLDLKQNCTVGYGQGIRTSCLPETAVSGIELVIEYKTNLIKNTTLICTDIPNIGSSCEPQDEKQQLFSYIGDDTNTEVTLKLQKAFGVGKSSVMADFNRNEFAFYSSTEFKIVSSIPALSENFKKNLAGSEHNFDWSLAPDNIWQEEKSVFVDIVTLPNCTIEVFEIVGRCSFIDVRLGRYTRVDICDGERNETEVSIPKDIINLTYKEDILKPIKKEKNYKPVKGILKGNAVEVAVEHRPFVLEKFLKKNW